MGGGAVASTAWHRWTGGHCCMCVAWRPDVIYLTPTWFCFLKLRHFSMAEEDCLEACNSQRYEATALGLQGCRAYALNTANKTTCFNELQFPKAVCCCWWWWWWYGGEISGWVAGY